MNENINNKNSGYEIDFLPAGGGGIKNGDAIAIRYGGAGDYKIMVVDGGTKESGETLVAHIKRYYSTAHVDYVVNTHPDADHASGLAIVLEQLSVGELWMHRPWQYAGHIKDAFVDGRITDNSLGERLKDEMEHAYALEKIATDRGVKIFQPFSGCKIGEFTVLSPTECLYKELIPEFDKSPEQKEVSALAKAIEMAATAVKKVLESWNVETLSEEYGTSAENESSVILYANIAGKGVLLTGDAGVNALTNAADYAESMLSVDLKSCRFYQIPHHGGRHNVTPTVLNRIVGTKIAVNQEVKKSAFVNVAKNNEEYPKKIVANAFKRRGVKVFTTRGGLVIHNFNLPDRLGWSAVEPLPLYDEVED